MSVVTFSGEIPVRFFFNGKVGTYAVVQRVHGGLAVGSKLRIREATRDGVAFSVRITMVAADERGRVFHAVTEPA